MSRKDRIFADDWRDCLREQYRSVIQQQDARTETTLTEVLYEVGFSADELAALKFEATLRADDMPDDYVPDEIRTQAYVGVDVPVEVVESAAEMVEVVNTEAVEEDDESEPALLDERVAAPELAEDDLLDATEPENEPDEPQQLSLF